jgi:alpha-glucoside transport system permease protein
MDATSSVPRHAAPPPPPLPPEPRPSLRARLFERRGAGYSPLRIPIRVRATFLVPALVILLAIIAYPIVYSGWLSVHDATGQSFVGLANFRRLFTDPATLTALRNNVIWVVTAPTLACALGLVFAVLSERVRWATAFKVVIFMPMAISFLAAGIIFELVYQADPGQGVANAVAVGVHDTFAPASKYPGAHPRAVEGVAAPSSTTSTLFTSSGGSFTTVAQYRPGAAATVPLLGFPVTALPTSSAQARPAATGPTAIAGTVWLDLVYGGGGSPGSIDPGKKGLPGITVEAVADGRVTATATTAADGTFALTGLSPGTEYRLELPAGNFAQPYRGVSWLGPSLVTPAIIASYLWIWAGFAMVLIAAGLANIPRELLEAARVDGAGEWQVFRRITVPVLAPVLLTVLVTLVINVLKVFDLVYIIAPGSTLPDANVLAVQMWSVSFGGAQDQGLGSAIGVFLYVLVLPALYFNIRRLRRERTES